MCNVELNSMSVHLCVDQERYLKFYLQIWNKFVGLAPLSFVQWSFDLALSIVPFHWDMNAVDYEDMKRVAMKKELVSLIENMIESQFNLVIEFALRAYSLA